MLSAFQTVTRRNTFQREFVIDCLEAHGFRLEILRQGAEMLSLHAPGGPSPSRGFLYRDGQLDPPAQGWANHATVMGYFIHRLWNQQSVYRGRLLTGGNHGFLRHFLFSPPSWDPTGARLTYRVPADQLPAQAYPLRVELQLSYQLTPRGVEVEFAFHNHEPSETAHFSFGLHPGFAISDFNQIELIFPPGCYRRHLAPGNFLNGVIEEIQHPGGVFPFTPEKLPDSYLLELPQSGERLLLLRDLGWHRHIALDFSDCPYVTLWSDGGPFLCVEPCWGLPDSQPPTAFEDKPGIQTLAAGASMKKTFRIAPAWPHSAL